MKERRREDRGKEKKKGRAKGSMGKEARVEGGRDERKYRERGKGDV